jgi:hypothetical protein
MKKTIKQFFKSWSFVISVVMVVGYLVNFIIGYKEIIINDGALDLFFFMFLEFLPLVVAIFAILISFTDKEFLKFLKDTKNMDNDDTLYNDIIKFFVINTLLIFISLILILIVKTFNILNYFGIQAGMIFIFTYTIISLVQLVRFIFYFAKRKSDFVS